MLVTTLMQVFKRQTTVIFFKVYLHHHSAAAGFFNLDQGQHLWTKKKKTNKVYINISLPLLLIQYQIPQHCLNPQAKKELSFIYLTSLTNWTEALESKECIHAALLVSPPLVHDKVVAYGRWSSTGKKKSILGDPVAVGLARKKGSILDLSILFLVPRFNGCL